MLGNETFKNQGHER